MNSRSQKILYLLLVVLLYNTVIYTQDFRKNATAGFTFLEIPVTARGAALGEAAIALSDMNSSAVFVNPGALGFCDKTHSLYVSYAPWIADIKNYASSYSYKSDLGVLGISFLMLDYGTMPRTVVASGQKVYDVTGSFLANSLALGLTYSRMLTDKFAFGISLKYAQEKIDIYTADNILLDGGVIYYTGLGSLRIAAVVSNFGVDTRFINDEFKMPAMLRLGASAEILGDYSSDYRITMMTEAVHPNDADERLNIGTELSWKNILTLRGGYKFFYDLETYSLGFGITPGTLAPLAFDFAYADYGRLGKISRISLQLGIF